MKAKEKIALLYVLAMAECPSENGGLWLDFRSVSPFRGFVNRNGFCEFRKGKKLLNVAGVGMFEGLAKAARDGGGEKLEKMFCRLDDAQKKGFGRCKEMGSDDGAFFCLSFEHADGVGSAWAVDFGSFLKKAKCMDGKFSVPGFASAGGGHFEAKKFEFYVEDGSGARLDPEALASVFEKAEKKFGELVKSSRERSEREKVKKEQKAQLAEFGKLLKELPMAAKSELLEEVLGAAKKAKKKLNG